MQNNKYFLDQVELLPERSRNELVMSRRNAIRLGVISGLTALTGCTSYRMLFNDYPSKYKTDQTLVKNVLKAFVTTIIPGINVKDNNHVLIFYDDFYGFSDHRGLFIYELSKRSRKLFGQKTFDSMNEGQRIAVVEDGEKGGKLISRLFSGAIILTQVSIFSGIYDDTSGCDLIGFQGSNYGFPPEFLTYAKSADLFSYETSWDGNFD